MGQVNIKVTRQSQGWVGSQLRLPLPEVGLFAKMLASRPDSACKPSKIISFGSASASLSAVSDGIGLGFGFVILFTTGFGFGIPKFCVWLPRFNGRFDKTFIHQLRFDFYLFC